MICLWVEQADSSWYGVAEHDGALVATVAAGSRSEAIRSLHGCVPDGAPCRTLEEASDFARRTVRMLAEIEAGNEAVKRFELSTMYVGEPLRAILTAAAAVPLGYVTTYGDIAAVAGTIARVVGHAMATNPLYPIVPCHRVVGADMSLVGYGGRQTPAALSAKLGRLRAEARGFEEERSLAAAGGLRVVPVERVLAKAACDEAPPDRQLTLW